MYAVEAPEIQGESRGGLLQVANVIPTSPGQVFYQGVIYQTALDGHARRVPAPGTDKTFDELGLAQGEPFSIYKGLDLSQFQRDIGEITTREAFEAGESFAVERAVQELALNPMAVDLTPTAGTPVTDKKLATGLLEQYAAEQYSGLPVIHANKLGTAILDPEPGDADSDWVLHTKQGTPVANGGGYGATGPGGAVAGASAAWVYISGQVNIWKSPLTLAGGDNLPTNRAQTLAEATYVSTVESFVAAILVGI